MEYSRTQVPRLCALFDENLENHDKQEEKKEEFDLEEENLNHSQTRKKQNVAHRSNPGKFQFTRMAQDEQCESKVKTS